MCTLGKTLNLQNFLAYIVYLQYNIWKKYTLVVIEYGMSDGQIGLKIECYGEKTFRYRKGNSHRKKSDSSKP